MTSQYEYPGDYKFEKIQIRSANGSQKEIKQLFNGMRIIEDIQNPYVTAELNIIDGIGLYHDMPIIGEETLDIKYTVDNNETIEREFTVYRVGSVSRSSESEVAYTLFMASAEAFEDANTKISRSYKQQTVDQIVQDVFDELGSQKSIDIDDVQGTQHIILPFWSPFKTINWMTKYAVNPSYTENYFVFYENHNGFHFKNLPTLYEQEPVEEVIPENVALKGEKESGEKWKGKKINDFTLSSTPDRLSGINDGRYATHITTVDNVTKDIQQSEAVARDEDLTLLNSEHTFTSNWEFDDPMQRFIVMATKQHRSDSGYFSNNAGGQLAAVNYQETNKWHSMVLSQLSSTTVDVEMHGITSITAGVVMRTKLPRYDSKANNSSDKKDKYRSGNYLITRCEHIFGNYYSISAKLQTNSYPDPLESEIG